MPENCTTCGNALPMTALGGMCPACLLAGGASPVSGSAPPPSDASMLLGRYALVEQIGAGGFGVVHRAEQHEPVRRTVAVKILRAEAQADQIMARFDAERQALALMDHPGIARVLDAGKTDDGQPFFVMDLVEGLPITRHAVERKLPLNQRLELFIEVCHAAHHAHQKGIIHRDIKPSNVLVGEDGGNPRPRLIDFGIAKALEGPLTDRTLYTGVGQMLGTPGYISPEQIEHGSAAVDVRSDVYALGSLLYELLCDAPLIDPHSFTTESLATVLKRLATLEPPRPSLRKPSLPGDLDAITQKALALEPERRYSSADAFAEDVRRYLNHEPVLARPPTGFYHARKFIRRHRAAVAAMAGVMAAIIVGGVSSTVLYRRAERARLQTRINFAESDFTQARLYGDRARRGDFIAHIGRCLRMNPDHERAAAYLHTFLGHEFLARTASPPLPAPGRFPGIRFISVNGNERVVGVCADAEDRQALVVWRSADEERGVFRLGDEIRVKSFLPLGDGRRIALGLADGRLWIWDTATAERLRAGKEADSPVVAIARVDGDGRIVYATANGLIRICRFAGEHPEEASSFNTESPVERIAVDADGRRMAVAAGRTVTLFGLATGKITGACPQYPAAVTALAMQPQGRFFGAGLEDGSVHLVAVPDGRPIGQPQLLSAAVSAMTFEQGGGRLIAGDREGFVLTRRTSDGRPMDTEGRFEGAILLCEAVGERSVATAVSAGGDLRRWHTRSRIRNARQYRQAIHSAAISADGTVAGLVINEGKSVVVWRLDARMVEPRYVSGARNTETGIEHPDYEVRLHRDNGVELFERRTGRRTTGTIRHTEPVAHTGITPDGRTLVTITARGRHRYWDVATGDPLGPAIRFPLGVKALAMGAAGRTYRVRIDNGDWLEYPLPPRGLRAPEWFLHLAEALARVRLREDGTSEQIPREALAEVVERIPDGTGPFEELARWLVADPMDRPLWPGLSQSFPDYLDWLLGLDEPGAWREVLRYEPRHPRALARLADGTGE